MSMRLPISAAGLVTLLVVATASSAAAQEDPDQKTAESFSVEQVVTDLKASSHRYKGLLDRPSMRAGIYILASGVTDTQRPHQRDEVYYVISGSGKLVVEDDTLAAVAGAVLFVAAKANHRFVEIDEDLELLVVFGGDE